MASSVQENDHYIEIILTKPYFPKKMITTHGKGSLRFDLFNQNLAVNYLNAKSHIITIYQMVCSPDFFGLHS